ncbi:hypothetical protein TSUD_332310 [Trifolium subterraneum]|uniref:Uncharacterized protein n=1 Tax=Trifolium subterraneum TaxID=3900 RepID=A0A2Z6MZ36_TRISU|nr:hypothetical protein TSUD_332310 [Trifolium subterraneum]
MKVDFSELLALRNDMISPLHASLRYHSEEFDYIFIVNTISPTVSLSNIREAHPWKNMSDMSMKLNSETSKEGSNQPTFSESIFDEGS